MKKHIGINFYGFWEGFQPESFFIYQMLCEKYDVSINENPDYAIISVFDYDRNYLKQKGVRIFYSGENVAPDFSEMDYAISFDHIHFGDRYFRYPMSYNDAQIGAIAQNKHRDIPDSVLTEKEYFCTFMYSHEGIPERTKLFHLLNGYKRVESVGKYLRNSDIVIPHEEGEKSKLDFQRKAKFVLAVENISFPGYATEKILHAFASQAVPIYYGDPQIAQEFNTEAFINCHDYASFEEVLEAVKRLDQDDEAYLRMLRQPAFREENYIETKREQFSRFLYNIFDQEYKKAFRRPLDGISSGRSDWLSESVSYRRKYLIQENSRLFNRIKRKLAGLRRKKQ